MQNRRIVRSLGTPWARTAGAAVMVRGGCDFANSCTLLLFTNKRHTAQHASLTTLAQRFILAHRQIVPSFDSAGCVDWHRSPIDEKGRRRRSTEYGTPKELQLAASQPLSRRRPARARARSPSAARQPARGAAAPPSDRSAQQTPRSEPVSSAGFSRRSRELGSRELGAGPGERGARQPRSRWGRRTA